jgi:integrase
MSRRHYGTGGVYQRGKTWWVRFCYRGRELRESSESTKRAEAVRLLKRRLAEMGAGRLVGPDSEKVTFADLAEMLRNDYRLNGRRSLDRAERSLDRLTAYFGEHARALDLTADRIVGYVAHRQEAKVAPATIRNELAALKRAFSLAVSAGRLNGRPAFPTIHVDNARRGFFERPDFEAVLAHLPRDLQPVAEFMYATGWRKGEVLGLAWSDVDLDAGVARIEHTKSGEPRTLPFHALPGLDALITAQRERTTEVERRRGVICPHVFHRQGRPIRDFRGAWQAACVAVGFATVTKDAEGKVIKVKVHRIPHDFRRTAVRNMERAGVSRSVAMKISGHKTESVYRRYAIVSEADLAEGLAKVAQLHAAEPAGRPKVAPLKAAV